MRFIERGHGTNYHLNQQRVSLVSTARVRVPVICSLTVNFQQMDKEEKEKVSAINLLVFIVFTDIMLDITKEE